MYRCQSLKEFWIAHPKLQKDYACHFESFEKLENKINKYTFENTKGNCPDANNFIDDLNEIMNREQPFKSSTEENYIYNHINNLNDSIRTQIHNIK
jgi:hypothetical protein